MSGQTLMSGMPCLANISLNKNERQQIGLPQNMKYGLYLTLKANFLYFFQRLTKSSKTKNQETMKFSRASYKCIKIWK